MREPMSHIFLVAILVIAGRGQDSGLRVVTTEDATRVAVSALLPKAVADQLPAGKMSQDEGEKWLQLCIVNDGKEGPAIIGSYERDGQNLVFTPRFALQNDKNYRACMIQAGRRISAVDYRVPPRPPAPPAEVVAVWPTNDVLPANQLRFYILFSRPMRGGSDIFEQIGLLDADGQEIADPWLRDELWNEDGTLLTLYIHPGRIKWGVLLRLLLGPVLEPDRQYTLLVRGSLLDADDRKLSKEYRKPFRTTAEDRTRLELSTWKIHAPEAGQRGSLTLAFPKPLDSRSLERFLTVVDAQGKPVKGKMAISRDAREWTFQPETDWTAQEYAVVVDRRLEDVAGNNPVHAFDVDADASPPPPQRLSLPFLPRQ